MLRAFMREFIGEFLLQVITL